MVSQVSDSSRRLRSPLARRLIVAIVLFSSAITLVLTAVQLYGEYRYDVKGIEANLEQVEQVHLRALTQSLWATNQNELALQLEGLVQVPNIEYVAVYEGDKRWAEAGRRGSRNVIERRYPMWYEHRGGPQQIGELVVVASLDTVYRHLINQAIVILVSNGIKTFLVAGFIVLFFYWLVNRHLLAITEHLRRLRPDQPAAALTLHRRARSKPDEFDELALAINGLHERNVAAVKALSESKQRFHAIADYTVDWESWIAPDGRLIWVNPSVQRVTGHMPAECLAMADFPFPLIAAEDQAGVRCEWTRALRGNSGENLEFRIVHKGGERRWAAMSWQPIYGPNGEFLGTRTSIRDITERKHLALKLEENVQELKRSEEAQARLVRQSLQEQARMTQLLSAMNIGILFEDVENRVVYFNPAFRRIWLIPEGAALTGRPTLDVLEHSANLLAQPDHFSKHVLQVLAAHEVSDTFEIVMADGRVVTQVSYVVRDAEGRFIGRLWVYEDVTRERQTAEQLIYLAERDSLTGLYNRHRFQEELSRVLADAERREGHGALLFFDLDEFKYINDTLGHRAGDAMLIRVAGEIGGLVRRNELLARLGGDEFAVLLPERTEADAARLAERIVRAVSQIPFRFEGQNLRLTTSLGIALYPTHGSSAEELIAHADTAMYQAKEAGKNAWRVYRQDLDASREIIRRLSWRERLTKALEQNLLRLHFQGVYHTANGRLSHLEALVRMVDDTAPDRLIMPSHFIPTAERTGLIVDIDRWVLREAVAALKRAPALAALAVNISGRSFNEPTLPQYITDLLASEGVAPQRLMVELTETSAVADLHDAQRFIEALRHAGCRVCLDDFGSGFSSFAYLKYLKADILKIDGLFIRDLPNDRDNQVFVKSIADVARGMGKITVAEFVEDAETLAMLKQFGVHLAQGYHLDMPRADHPGLHGGGTE